MRAAAKDLRDVEQLWAELAACRESLDRLQQTWAENAPAAKYKAELAACIDDAKRLEWYFNPKRKHVDFMSVYMRGVREEWTVDQWRAAIDAERSKT